MRVLAIVHQDDAGPGVFADAVRAAGHELEVWRPDRGEAPPDGADAVMVFGGAMDTRDPLPWLARREGVPRRTWWRAGRRCSASASARSCWRRPPGGSVRRARAAGDRLDRGGSRRRWRPADGRPARALHSLRLAFLRGSAPRPRAWRSRAATPHCRPSGSTATPRGGSSSTPRSPRTDMRNWIENFHTDPDAAGTRPRRAARRERAAAGRVERAWPGAVRAVPAPRRRDEHRRGGARDVRGLRGRRRGRRARTTSRPTPCWWWARRHRPNRTPTRASPAGGATSRASRERSTRCASSCSTIQEERPGAIIGNVKLSGVGAATRIPVEQIVLMTFEVRDDKLTRVVAHPTIESARADLGDDRQSTSQPK